MISKGRDRVQNEIEGLTQKRGCTSIIEIKFIAQNIDEEKLKREVVAGSNDEKISTIIKAY